MSRCGREERGSIPRLTTRSKLAQSVARQAHNLEVDSSNLSLAYFCKLMGLQVVYIKRLSQLNYLIESVLFS